MQLPWLVRPKNQAFRLVLPQQSGVTLKPQEAQLFANEIQSSIVMFMAISEVIEKQPASLKQRVLGVVDGEITRLRAEKELLQKI